MFPGERNQAHEGDGVALPLVEPLDDNDEDVVFCGRVAALMAYQPGNACC